MAGEGKRFAVLRRDGFACRYCGAKAPDVVLHVDHVVPRSAGGSDDEGNLVSACASCNLGKGDVLLDGTKRKRRARRPRPRPLRRFNSRLPVITDCGDCRHVGEEGVPGVIVLRQICMHPGGGDRTVTKNPPTWCPLRMTVAHVA